MFQNWLSFAFAFTGLGFVITIFRVGAEMLLFLAILGPAAIWLAPPFLALALPSALLGGVLLATAGPRISDYRPRVREVAALAIISTSLSLLIVGWAMPAGFRASDQSIEKYRSSNPSPTKVAAASLDLPELLVDASPEARRDLLRRMEFFLPTLFVGVFVTVLVASPLTWPRSVAFSVSILAFALHISSMPLH